MRLRLERWEEREAGVISALRYVLLGICLLITLFAASDEVRGPVWVVVVLSAATAAWMLWWTTLHPEWRDRPGLMRWYFAGLVVLMAPLVVLAPWYGFFTFTGYFALPFLPMAWIPFGLVGIATVTGTSQNGGLPAGDAGSIAIWALIVAVNVAIAGIITFFAWVGERDHEERARLVEELREVNAQLEATLRENEQLQDELVTRAREDAVTGERQRMARELHDTLAQGLIGIITQLEAAEDALPDVRRRHLDAARALARDSLTEARRSMHAMRPEPLEDARLPEALAGEARRWTELHGVEADVTTTGDARPLGPELEITLLRAAQEALANVAKHAAASRVGVTLSYMDDLVMLDVRDDGMGFAVNGQVRGHDGGLGLVGMRERVESLDGTLAIESEPGAGTAISVTVPVRS